MSIASKLSSVSVADYLAGEQSSRIKYEYVDGRIFAWAGFRKSARARHFLRE